MHLNYLTRTMGTCLFALGITYPVHGQSVVKTAANHFEPLQITTYLKKLLNSNENLFSTSNLLQVNDPEDDIEDEVEQSVEDEVEDSVEDEVEQSVEDEVEHNVEDEVEDSVEDEVEQSVEDEVEDNVEDEVEHSVEDEVEHNVEDEVEQSVEDEVEHKVEDEVEHSVEDEVEDDVADKIEERSVDAAALSTAEYVTEHISNQVESQLDLIQEVQGEQVFSSNWLVLSDLKSLQELTADGYSITNKQYLEGLDLFLATLEAPESYDLKTDQYSQLMSLNTQNRAVDVNHLFGLAQQGTATDPTVTNTQHTPQKNRHKIGIIDSAVNLSHPSLLNSRIYTQDFAAIENALSTSHGTAIASILVGQAPQYSGLLSNQELWSAAVFFADNQGDQVATTVSLIKAINWLIQSKVDIINMSLAGPQNNLLQVAVERACNKNLILVASVGNAGPAAEAQYPAAYECTLAVTAIDKRQRVYRRAIRGQHVDMAAYGVDVIHADDKNSYKVSSGTSYAAPLASAWLATNLPAEHDKWHKWLEAELRKLQDLGESGKDPVYGYGAIPDKYGHYLVQPD